MLEGESRLAQEAARLRCELDEARAELAATAAGLYGLQHRMHGTEAQKVHIPDG